MVFGYINHLTNRLSPSYPFPAFIFNYCNFRLIEKIRTLTANFLRPLTLSFWGLYIYFTLATQSWITSLLKVLCLHDWHLWTPCFWTLLTHLSLCSSSHLLRSFLTPMNHLLHGVLGTSNELWLSYLDTTVLIGQKFLLLCSSMFLLSIPNPGSQP